MFSNDINHLVDRTPLDSPTLPSSPSPSALTQAHINEAISRSPDNGATLDLSHLGISDVGEEGAEELAAVGDEAGPPGQGPIVRMALGYNRLTTLPMGMAQLTAIRYLNLRNNNLAAFPDVLTVMPSLEILDIRRNKLKKFPRQPGSMSNLKVLSLSRNKITRLPTYFAELISLETLGLDHNPIEWPPKGIMEPYPSFDDKEIMKAWIQCIRKFIGDHAATPNRQGSDELVNQPAWPFPRTTPRTLLSPAEPEFEMVTTPHARTFSIESDVSAYSEKGRSPLLSPAGSHASGRPAGSPRPAPLQLDLPMPLSDSGSAASARSPDSYLPTPDASVASSADEDYSPSPPGGHASAGLHSHLHMRGGSSAPSTSSRSTLAAKKSLPNLRTAKFPFGGDQQKDRGIRIRTHNELPQLPEGTPGMRRRKPADGLPPKRGMVYHDETFFSSPRAHDFGDNHTSSPTSLHSPGPPVEVERNSYFRRLSTISSSTIHQTVPPALLTVVEGVRDIMFAVTQIHETLKCYAQTAADATLSSVLHQVLDPASQYIKLVISALERFDIASRRAIPPPSICRAVVEGCKDMVSAFGKAVNILFAQLKVIALTDDKRYTRQMLLILYGSTAEISRAWVHMGPAMDTVRPLLAERNVQGGKSRIVVHLGADFQRRGHDGPFSAPPGATRGVPLPSGSRTPRSRGDVGSDGGSEKVRRARRQAGSFSVKDVELGRTMASFAESPPVPSFVGTPTSAQMSTPRAIPLPSPSPSSAMSAMSAPQLYHTLFGGTPATATGPSFAGAHSRQGSAASSLASASPVSSSSPIVATRAIYGELPSSSSTLADNDTIAAVARVLEAAPPVWLLMGDIAHGSETSEDELKDMLSRAVALTTRVKERLDAVVQVGNNRGDRLALFEEAKALIKLVVKLAGKMKVYKDRLAPSAGPQIVKLTNATEACLMLLHVSSFAPPATSAAAASRPYSPRMFSPLTNSPVVASNAGAGESPLGRSKSAYHAPTRSPNAAAWREAPRSAHPAQQSFQVGTPPRTASLARPGVPAP